MYSGNEQRKRKMKTQFPEREDLTEYSDAELSLRVFNDEGLYRLRRRSYFIEELEQIFIFTEEQREELENDLKEENEEEPENTFQELLEEVRKSYNDEE